MKKTFIYLATLLLSACSDAVNIPADLPVAEYAVTEYGWQANGLGNHRAVIQVADAAEAVRVLIPWRRHDVNVAEKAIFVYDANGRQVQNIHRFAVDQEKAELAFEPISGAGTYYCYYLPHFFNSISHFDSGTYFTAEKPGNAGWSAKAAAAGRSLPEAKVIRLESRSAFDSFYPMEVAATAAETAKLREAFAGEEFVLFGEDRTRPVKMLDHIPAIWLQDAAVEEFSGNAQPGEWYTWQIAVWAHKKTLQEVSVTWSDFSGANGVIPAEDITCINVEGTDFGGNDFVRTIDISAGSVRPLWFIADIPADAAGTYSGTVTVADGTGAEKKMTVSIQVAGEYLADHGVSDSWRMSRLKWLNSRIGADWELIPPYTAVTGDENAVGIVGREIKYGSNAMPESITANGKEILAAPVSLVWLQEDGSPVEFVRTGSELVRSGDWGREEKIFYTADAGTLTVLRKLEAHGAIRYEAVFTPAYDITLQNIELVIPTSPEASRYWMGFGIRGGFRNKDIDWKWHKDYAHNYIWVGDADAGIQLYLNHQNRGFASARNTGLGLPETWYNNDLGGASVYDVDGGAVITAYTGRHALQAGREFNLKFRLLVTPMKPITPDHWSLRYAGHSNTENARYSLLFHAQPGNPNINYPLTDEKGFAAAMEASRKAKVKEARNGLAIPEYLIDKEACTVEFYCRIPEEQKTGFKMFQGKWRNGFFDIKWETSGRVSIIQQDSVGATTENVVQHITVPFPADGVEHKVTLSWQRNGSICFWLDDQLLAQGEYVTSWADSHLPENAVYVFPCAVPVRDLKIFNGVVSPVAPQAEQDAACVLYLPEIGGGAVVGETPLLNGMTVADGDMVKVVSSPDAPSREYDLYYTARELTCYTPELWALRAIGDEMFSNSSFVYAVEKTVINGSGGGNPWLQEHLVTGYSPGWFHPLIYSVGVDAFDMAIGQTGYSRWHNFYLEMLNYMAERYGLNGIYLDGVGFEPELLRRACNVFRKHSPDFRISYHCGNNYDFLNMRGNPMGTDMEHFAFCTSAWMGEMFTYDCTPDYWLVEMSGIPLGITSDMLNNEYGGNIWRGMQFMETGRMSRDCIAIWDMWDEWQIQDAEFTGFWENDIFVTTDNPNVNASVYVKPDGTFLAALAHWPPVIMDVLPKQASVAPAAEAPVIDGVLTDTAWEFSNAMNNFHCVGGVFQTADQQTQAGMTFDDRYLYLAANCIGAPRKSAVTQRDGQCWEDDSLEIFIRPDMDSEEYWQIIVSSAGGIYDAVGKNGSARDMEGVTAAVSRNDAGWCAEVAIPWSSLNIAPGDIVPGKRMGFNVCRDHQLVSGTVFSSWSPVKNGFHEISEFGVLKIDTAPTLEAIQDIPKGGDLNVRLNFSMPVEDTLRVYPIRWLQEESFIPANGVITVPYNAGIILEGKLK